jgi:antirestriction protein
MLMASPEPWAEEYAIHDYEGFGGLRLSEYATLETVAAIARGIDEHGLAFAAWAEHVGVDDHDRLEQFDSAYLGTYPSIEDFAEQYAEDIGLGDELVPAWARAYFRLDIEALARDLATDLVVADSRGGGVYVFDPNV